MDFEAIQTFLAVFIAICGGIVCIAGLVAAVVRFWKWAHKDSEKNAQDIEEFKSWLGQAAGDWHISGTNNSADSGEAADGINLNGRTDDSSTMQPSAVVHKLIKAE